MPDLRGLSGREALRELARLGISARVVGDGIVIGQEIPAGAPVQPGVSCRLHLARDQVPPDLRAMP
jgi:beta-lactam-binding protein with PASTA domain